MHLKIDKLHRLVHMHCTTYTNISIRWIWLFTEIEYCCCCSYRYRHCCGQYFWGVRWILYILIGTLCTKPNVCMCDSVLAFLLLKLLQINSKDSCIALQLRILLHTNCVNCEKSIEKMRSRILKRRIACSFIWTIYTLQNIILICTHNNKCMAGRQAGKQHNTNLSLSIRIGAFFVFTHRWSLHIFELLFYRLWFLFLTHACKNRLHLTISTAVPIFYRHNIEFGLFCKLQRKCIALCTMAAIYQYLPLSLYGWDSFFFAISSFLNFNFSWELNTKQEQ